MIPGITNATSSGIIPLIDPKITSPAIAAIVSLIVTIITNIFITRYNSKNNEKNKIEDTLLHINKLSINYPYVEDIEFTHNYKSKEFEKDMVLRYDVFCVIVFNFLEKVSKFYNYDKNKIENYIHIKEIVYIHKNWWIDTNNFLDNFQGYNKIFRELIGSYLIEK